MAPDDLTTPAPVRLTHAAKHSFNFSSWPFTSSAQETQLKSFLTFAAFILEALLARPVQQDSTKLRDLVKEDLRSGPLTQGSITLTDTNEFLVGRPVHFITFKEASSTSFICCYGPGLSTSRHEYAHQGCVCIFDILSRPSRQYTLLVHGVPLCAAWSMNGRSSSNWGVIVAGTQYGSLALWDLSTLTIGTSHRTCTLQPTYSTNCRIEENHTAPIQKVCLDGSSSKELSAGRLGGVCTENFLKLLSIDKLGFVHMWIAKDVQATMAARDDEPGLHPDGRLYLVRTGVTNAVPRNVGSLEMALPEACTFATIPGRVQEILVAMSDGSLVKTSLVGSRPSAPRIFTRQLLKGSKCLASPVLSLCFSPFVEDCFLVAYADSTVAVFTMESAYPWSIWALPSIEYGSHIISAQWSPFEAVVFLVASSSRTVHVFDLSRGEANPKFSETLHSRSDDVLRFELSKRGSRSNDGQHSFVTASAVGDVEFHLLKHTSNECNAEGLQRLLLAPADMI